MACCCLASVGAYVHMPVGTSPPSRVPFFAGFFLERSFCVFVGHRPQVVRQSKPAWKCRGNEMRSTWLIFPFLVSVLLCMQGCKFALAREKEKYMFVAFLLNLLAVYGIINWVSYHMIGHIYRVLTQQ